MRNELKNDMKKQNEKMQLLQLKVSDAELEIANYKKRTEELENKVENQQLTIEQLEKTLEEKIVEDVVQRLRITDSGNSSTPPIMQTPPRPIVAKENFGLTEKQLEIIANYGKVSECF